MRLSVPPHIGERIAPLPAETATTRLSGLIENLERRVTALERRLARRHAAAQGLASSTPHSTEHPLPASSAHVPPPSHSPAPSTSGPRPAFDDDDPIELVVRLPKIQDIVLDLLRQSAPKETRVRWR